MNARFLFTLAAAAGFTVALGLAWIPVPDAVSHFVLDDMGYYLLTAHNAVSGRGVTLDGINPTNGFHPLWMMLLGLEALLPGASPALLFHLALTTCAFTFAVTCLVICRDVRDRMVPALAAPLAALLLFNFRLASIPLGGLETALAGLSIIAAVSYVATFRGDIPLRRATVLGLLLGVACLSRWDALLFSGIVLAWIGYRSLALGIGRAIGIVGVAAAAMLGTLLPWFVFSWTAVRAWLPRSGEAIRLFTPAPWGTPWSVDKLQTALRVTVVGPSGDIANAIGVWPLVNAGRITHLGGAAALATAALAIGTLAWRARRDPLVAQLLWVPVYAVSTALYYCRFTSNHIRYLYPATLAMIYFSAAVVAASLGRSDRPALIRRVHVCAALMIAVGTVAGISAYRLNVGAAVSHLGQRALLEDVTGWLTSHTTPSARVGSFNGGLISEFSGRTTVNLDGVMNDNAIAALHAGRLCAYIDSERIAYLADNLYAIEFFMDADASCRASRWRSRWRVAYSVQRRVDTTGDLQPFVVMTSAPE